MDTNQTQIVVIKSRTKKIKEKKYYLALLISSLSHKNQKNDGEKADKLLADFFSTPNNASQQ